MIKLLLLLLSINCYAGENKHSKEYFTIKKVVRTVTYDDGSSMSFVQDKGDGGIVPIKPTKPPIQLPDDAFDPYDDGYSTNDLSVLDTFVKIWTIVADNKPVVTVDAATSATALPAISNNHWTAIGGWKPERNITYTTAFGNGFGMTTVYLQYQVKLVYGGNLNGRGLYIASAKITPIKIRVLWGYTVDVNVSAPSVFNVRTPQNPIAAIQLNVIYDIKTIINEDYQTDTYQVQGDGLIQDTKTGEILLPAVLN